MASWIKPVLISTSFVAIAMHLKVIVPALVLLDFSIAPILLSSFLSWLKPPYLYVIINIIIIVIGVSSRFYKSISNHNNKDYEVSYEGNYKYHQTAPSRWTETKDIDFSLVSSSSQPKIIVEEKERPEAVVEKLEEEKMCLVLVEKPLVSARIGHRKLVKTTTAERTSLRALRVAKPRKNETLENTWKLITEGKPPPLTSHYRRPDTFGLGLDDTKQQGGLKKSETFKDRAKYYLSPAVSRSRDELNRRADSFIKKCNDERFESMRQDQEVARQGLSF